MNELTKDELKEILYCVSHYQSCKWSNPELLELEGKLKSMIDTYCEHSWAFHFGSDGSQIKCQKCLKEL